MKHLVSLSTQTIDELRELHESLEARLEELQSARFLSQEEKYEVQIIKKRKLLIKDRINQLRS